LTEFKNQSSANQAKLLPLLQHEFAKLIDAEVGDQDLIRARARLRFSPKRAKTREIACIVGSNSSSGRKASNNFALYGTEPKPRRRRKQNRRCTLPLTILVLAMAPMSCMVTKPQGFLLTAGKCDLHLAAEVLRIGMTIKNFEQALA